MITTIVTTRLRTIPTLSKLSSTCWPSYGQTRHAENRPGASRIDSWKGQAMEPDRTHTVPRALSVPARLGGVLIALLVAVTACTGTDHFKNQPELVQPGEPSEFGAGTPATHPNQPYSFGAVIVCLKERGSVTIDRIDVVQPTGGIRMKNFAARANPTEYGSDGYGAGNETLSVAGFPPSRPVTIDKKCAGDDDKVTDEQGSFELGLEFTKADDVTAQTHGLQVRYSSGKKQRTLEIPFTVVLCAASDKTTEGCG